MITFLICLTALIIAYFTYGRRLERLAQIDSGNSVPSERLYDGIDYVPMPRWKVFLIQLLNIAGTGPIFGAILGCCAWMLAVILTTLVGFFKGIYPDTEMWLSAAFILAIIFMILALMLPFQLKFGGERGRIALIVCLVLVSVLGTLAVKGLQLIGIDLATILDTMPTVHAGILAAILLIVALLLLGLSCLISIGIMQKKEF